MKDKDRPSYYEYKEISERVNNPDQEWTEFIHKLQEPFFEDIWKEVMAELEEDERLSIVNNIPQDPFLCRLIIESLLERFAKIKSSEGKTLRGVVLAMANIERLLISPKRKVREYFIELNKIASGRVVEFQQNSPSSIRIIPQSVSE